MRATVFSKVSLSLHLSIKRVSAPNISGTSVSIVLPPFEIRISENSPTIGFAVIPESPSEPPHFIPIISSLASISSLFSSAILFISSSISESPVSISSSTSCEIRNFTLLSSISPR